MDRGRVRLIYGTRRTRRNGIRTEVWELQQNPKTTVYVARLIEASRQFSEIMTTMAGSEEIWRELRQRLVNEGRHSELLTISSLRVGTFKGGEGRAHTVLDKGGTRLAFTQFSFRSTSRNAAGR